MHASKRIPLVWVGLLAVALTGSVGAKPIRSFESFTPFTQAAPGEGLLVEFKPHVGRSPRPMQLMENAASQSCAGFDGEQCDRCAPPAKAPESMSPEESAFYENVARNPPKHGPCPQWEPGKKWPAEGEPESAGEDENFQP